MRIRVVGTGSGKKAIQVVSKRYGKVIVHKHIGSFENEAEETRLRTEAQRWIKAKTGQLDFWDFQTSVRPNEVEIGESRLEVEPLAMFGNELV